MSNAIVCGIQAVSERICSGIGGTMNTACANTTRPDLTWPDLTWPDLTWTYILFYFNLPVLLLSCRNKLAASTQVTWSPWIRVQSENGPSEKKQNRSTLTRRMVCEDLCYYITWRSTSATCTWLSRNGEAAKKEIMQRRSLCKSLVHLLPSCVRSILKAVGQCSAQYHQTNGF